MKISCLLEFISAAHVTRYCDKSFEDRGGIFLVAPPGQLKSTIIREALSPYPDALNLSDLNVRELALLKESLTGGRYSTLGFGEFEKLYARNPATASNLEMTLQGMVAEGFDKMSFQSQQMASYKCRIMMVCGIVPSVYEKRFQTWLGTGFARRFLWMHYRLASPDIIPDAIHRWRQLSFGKVGTAIPGNRSIPFHVMKQDSSMLRGMLRDQPACDTTYILVKKIFSVLCWRYGRMKAKKITEDVAPSFSRNGSELTL